MVTKRGYDDFYMNMNNIPHHITITTTLTTLPTTLTTNNSTSDTTKNEQEE